MTGSRDRRGPSSEQRRRPTGRRTPTRSASEPGVPQVVAPSRTQQWTEDVRASRKGSGAAPPPPPSRTNKPRPAEERVGPAVEPPTTRPVPTASIRDPDRQMEHWMGGRTGRHRSQEVAAIEAPTFAEGQADVSVEMPRSGVRGWLVLGAALIGLGILALRDRAGRVHAVSGPIAAAVQWDEQDEPSEGVAVGQPVVEALEPFEGTRTGARDPREPPPGTSPAAATALRHLPVSAADRAPVGGIGENGIHVDRISTGSRYERGGYCRERNDRYSVSSHERVNVCFRVVHPRDKDEVYVFWEKDGGTMRRSKVYINPTHAYRTRAYLVLRSEYVGHWTVRVESLDEVVLARESFTVVD